MYPSIARGQGTGPEHDHAAISVRVPGSAGVQLPVI